LDFSQKLPGLGLAQVFVTAIESACPEFTVFSMAKKAFWPIGLGASKFLGVRRIFAQIFPNLPKKFLCDFHLQIFSHKNYEDLFGVTSKKSLHLFFCRRWRHFLKSNCYEWCFLELSLM